MSIETLYRKANDEYATPAWLYDGIFRGWFDPCPLRSMSEDRTDGLSIEWKGDRIFINPPYSNPLPWVKQAIEEARKGKTVVLLLKHDSSTAWWRMLHEAGAHFLPVMGRLNFNGKPAPFPSVLVVLYGREIASQR